MIILIVFLIFVAVTTVVFFFTQYFSEKMFLDKVQKVITPKETRKKKDLTAGLRNLFLPFARSRWKFLQRYREKIETQIRLAGKPKDLDFPLFLALQTIIGLFLILFVLEILEITNFFLLFIAFLFGFFSPIFWLKSKVETRQRNIFRSLPDVLDILTLSMEAGLDFGAGLNKYLEKSEKNLLHQELFIVQQEIHMGKSRIEALNSLAERVNLPALNSVVSSIVQGLQLGSSLGPLLRAQASSLRVQRFQMAEKLAAQAPIKMLFPLLFFIFPTVFIILFAPIFLSFFR